MVITDFNQVTAGWLAGCLRNSGALVNGNVAGIDVLPNTADNSRNAKIAVRYTPAATGALPAKLFLKLCSGDDVFGPSEVNYYTRDYVGLAGAPMLRCFDARYQDSRDALKRFFDMHPRLMIERARDQNGFTVVHGDDNPGNVLSPQANGESPLYLIDRQPFDWSLTTWLGANDLSYAMAHWWPAEARRACERPMLQRYYDVLLQRGVQGFSFRQLLDDYRLSIGLSVYVAVKWCAELTDPMPMKWLWWGSCRRRCRRISIGMATRLPPKVLEAHQVHSTSCSRNPI